MKGILRMLEQILLLVGVSIFGVLGCVHLIYTFFTDKFNAYDASVTEAMKGTSPVLTKETTVWKAWVGFNASHSLGAMLVAGFYLPLLIKHFELIQQSLWFSLLPIVIGLSYLFLAKQYWFKIPFTGVLISTICFLLAGFLINT
jgi:hypothetical protein